MVNLNFAVDSQISTTQGNSPEQSAVSQATDIFAQRHIGVNEQQIQEMLQILGIDSLDALIDQTVPAAIRLHRPLQLPAAQSEAAALARLKAIAKQNQVYRSFIGRGYSNCITPAVILRNILENPGWYTAYTPYQAEIGLNWLRNCQLFSIG
jgi:glycine dehydrogenase